MFSLDFSVYVCVISRAARHGCKLNGKLQRLEEQEKAIELGLHEKEQKESSAKKKRKCKKDSSKAAYSHKKLPQSPRLDSRGHKNKKHKQK